MRIAVSGTHAAGKSTPIADLHRSLKSYLTPDEPYYELLEESYDFTDPLSSRLRRWTMSRFRLCALPFAVWGIVFLFLPRFTNEFAGIAYTGSQHAQDWTQLVGLFSIAFALLLHEAHRSADVAVRRIVARVVLTVTLPSALLMTYWQLAPDRQWIRLDIVNILILFTMSFAMLPPSALSLLRRQHGQTTPSSHPPDQPNRRESASL